MPAEQKKSHPLLKVHAIGASLCILIAVGSLYFAGSSIAKRRGLYLSARHELGGVKAELNEFAKRRGSLAARVQRLEAQTAGGLELAPVSQLNTRTAAIVSLFESAGIRVDSLQPQQRIVDARVPVQPLLMVGQAGPDAVARALSLLDDRMPDIHLQLLEMGSDGESSMTMRVRFLLFWFVDPAGD